MARCACLRETFGSESTTSLSISRPIFTIAPVGNFPIPFVPPVASFVVCQLICTALELSDPLFIPTLPLAITTFGGRMLALPFRRPGQQSVGHLIARGGKRAKLRETFCFPRCFGSSLYCTHVRWPTATITRAGRGKAAVVNCCCVQKKSRFVGSQGIANG